MKNNKHPNLEGQKFGKLLVKKWSKRFPDRSGWICDCDCGVKGILRTTSSLISKKCMSCGCLIHRKIEIGERIGLLTVVESVSSKRGFKFRCQCDCGNQIELLAGRIRNQSIKSCGCLNKHPVGKDSHVWKGYEGLSGSYWDRLRKNAIKRRIKFDITPNETWELFINQNRRCALTGELLIMHVPMKGNNQTASLDRIDNSKGYIKGNVWWVHKDINMMKNNMNLNYFVNLCKNVAKNFGSYENVLTLNIFNDLQTLVEKYQEVTINEKI